MLDCPPAYASSPVMSYADAMEPLRARVRNGRLFLDEPTDLAEGSIVPLEITDGWDDLDDEERAALHRELAASISERKAGAPTFDAAEVLAELSARGK
ncbi:MAG TPA: hypothetical protein VJT73_06995 [Polyangiaceae bacterium]|nr:hypothetical protein [Polyangiaceae bacterium]